MTKEIGAGWADEGFDYFLELGGNARTRAFSASERRGPLEPPPKTTPKQGHRWSRFCDLWDGKTTNGARKL